MIYLIHSSVPIGGNGRAGARHYLGFTADGNLEQRMAHHLSGKSKVGVIKAFLENGGKLTIAMLWPDGGPSLEKYLKKGGHFDALCPLCLQEKGKTPPKTLPVFQPISLNLLATRWRRRTPASGGGRSRGNRTASIGASQVALPWESSTSSPAEAVTAPASGGTSSGATAQPRVSVGASAGTKQRSSSGSSKRISSGKARVTREAVQRPA